MSGYYGVRRSFLSDSDFHSSKQFPNDLYASSATKSFACESSAGQSHTGLLESYLTEPYGDCRPPALTPTPSSLFSTSTLPPLLPPPFPSDPAHFVFVSSVASALVGSKGGPSYSDPTLMHGTQASARCDLLQGFQRLP